MSCQKLERLYAEWKIWSLSANKDEDGWESDFPMWSDLMSAAMEAMGREDLSHEDLDVLAHCWAISEESEELREFAENNVDSCWPVLEVLTGSDSAACRWQAYVAAAKAGPRARKLLSNGIADSDSYVRRRCILSLASIASTEDRLLAETLISDPDPYIRQAAIELVRAINDPALKRITHDVLANDPVAHVRTAAHNRLVV
jgi:HEAT repeat protein